MHYRMDKIAKYFAESKDIQPVIAKILVLSLGF